MTLDWGTIEMSFRATEGAPQQKLPIIQTKQILNNNNNVYIFYKSAQYIKFPS